MRLLQILNLAFALFCVTASASNLTRLPDSEVNALQKIALGLGVNWDFNVDPCSGHGRWVPMSSPSVVKNVTCDCGATSNVCHVTSIQLKGLNLMGFLPDEFANLTYLSILDLMWNCLNGSIPVSWASLPLINLNLQGNRIYGQIPEELGSITTLMSLTLEDNLLQGPLPQSLAKLVNLEQLILTGNNITGELPVALGNLRNLTDFRIDGNPISGKIPNFITNWTKLQRLDLQGTSLEGPFPLNFSSLQTLTQLSISDIKGVMFPPLKNMNLQTLILRNLSLSGQIPDDIGNMATLVILDLSFNNLTGEIPGSFSKLQKIHNMYLTNNYLNGSIPSWIQTSNQNLDISYNNFTGLSPPSNCQQGNVNSAASYSPTYGEPISSCFKRNLPCTGDANNYNLFINCGGTGVTVDTYEYEDDSSSQGPSTYVTSASEKWTYISTGNFIDSVNPTYIVTNTSVLKMSNPELYRTARVSAISLKYNGLCLQNGIYTVKLHFAEIVFTDDQTYASNGRRLFDVSIQGQKLLRDFNIAKEANGTGREIVKTFLVIVTESTLEIELLWAGKGTRSIPQMGVYGPLISAITVTPNFTLHTGGAKLSVGSIAGISIACAVATLFVLTVLWIWWRRKQHENKEFGGLKLQGSYFSLEQIKAATNNFNPTNKIGEGGFGSVYQGVLPDGSVIAVKQLSSKSKQGNREFLTEIGMISGLQHPNLVKLFGCCVEKSQLLLVYEYMENNCLARALFGPERSRLKLDWDTRCKICLGIARGLAYLHEESKLKIVHRDIKATNILLDKDLNAKISDFGLAKLNDEENTHISTRIAGTIGYMAPEYAMRGYLTDKADVYSFGVVVLELVSGKSNTELVPKQEFMYMFDWVHELQQQGRLRELVDPNLGSKYSENEVMRLLNIVLACINRSQNLRPAMSSVVSMLEGRTPTEVSPTKLAIAEGETSRLKAFEKLALSDGSEPSLSSSVSAYSNIIEEKETSFFAENQIVSSELPHRVRTNSIS